jgi:hypothetical protein
VRLRPEAQDKVEVPSGSRAVFIQGNGEFVGPVTGKRYRIYPNLIAIDVREADAVSWLQSNVAREPMAGFKGHLTRID